MGIQFQHYHRDIVIYSGIEWDTTFVRLGCLKMGAYHPLFSLKLSGKYGKSGLQPLIAAAPYSLAGRGRGRRSIVAVAYLFAYLSIYLPIYLSTYLSIYLYICI